MKSTSQGTWGRHWRRAQRTIGACPLALVFGLLAGGCGAVPDVESGEPANEATAALTFPSSFRCGATFDKACTNTLAFDLPSNLQTEVTIRVIRYQGLIRLGAFAPGVSPVTGTNLLTGSASDFRCGNTPPLTKTFKTSGPGIYRVALSLDPTTVSGRKDYEVEVTANNTISYLAANSENGLLTSRPISCGFQQQISGTWNCATGVHCQDVYDIEAQPNSTLTVEVHPNGVSAGRLAVFDQFEPLNGKNLLTGVSKDFNCHGRSPLEIAQIVGRSGGHYKVAFGGDATLSLTTTPPFTYTAAIRVVPPSGNNSAFTPHFGGRFVNDKASQATGIQCGTSP